MPALDNAHMIALVSSFPFTTTQASDGPRHVLLPWASALSESCQQTWAQLDALETAGHLPHLRHLLNTLRTQTWLRGDEYAMQVPHELLWAKAQGWSTDKSLPMGAWLAQQAGLLTADTASQAWGLITPCHWHMGHDSLTMWSPDELHLTADDSRALFDAVKPWFDSDGWALHWVSSLQWLVSHPSLADLPAASIDRVTGRNPDVWLPADERARPVRRLQAEVQMLWYDNAVNNAREAQGLPPVNSFWLSGCGVLPASCQATSTPTPTPTPLVVCQDLRQTLMHGDMAAWLQAWQTLDAGPLADAACALKQGHAVQLSVCGERHAITLSLPAPANTWQKFMARLQPSAPLRLSALLQTL
jgi:hypothetical protein